MWWAIFLSFTRLAPQAVGLRNSSEFFFFFLQFCYHFKWIFYKTHQGTNATHLQVWNQEPLQTVSQRSLPEISAQRCQMSFTGPWCHLETEACLWRLSAVCLLWPDSLSLSFFFFLKMHAFLFKKIFYLFVYLFIWPHGMAFGILIPQPGTKPTTPTVKVQILNHWTAREVPLSWLLTPPSSNRSSVVKAIHLFFSEDVVNSLLSESVLALSPPLPGSLCNHLLPNLLGSLAIWTPLLNCGFCWP